MVDGVDAGHRCHAEDQEPIPLDRAQQARICLTGAYDRCERYLARATRNGGLAPARSGIVEGLVSTRMILAPDPAWRGIAGRARGAPGGSLLAIGAAGLALGIGGVAVASVDGLGGNAFTDRHDDRDTDSQPDAVRDAAAEPDADGDASADGGTHGRPYGAACPSGTGDVRRAGGRHAWLI